ncbi:hypothetical protein LSTR_LSTR000870 [Laodelphax striatellus]|uniref:Uncharacterized protein n=1 Tax=Laodelphax striatellus TaxID=195883 RepID=A0A482WF25_LAOST|nr:hypothetical protein LSTR_LSTR014920 [Laodelphax striatellus]RZF39349.1 hypothetical protein LSTR_LSTR000870 [Laodelphax striatellus]
MLTALSPAYMNVKFARAAVFSFSPGSIYPEGQERVRGGASDRQKKGRRNSPQTSTSSSKRKPRHTHAGAPERREAVLL